MPVHSSTVSFKSIRDILFQAFLTGLLFLIFTSGAFLIDRETYNWLSAHRGIHGAGLNTLIIAGALVCWLRYRAGPKTFFTLQPPGILNSFLELRPAYSLAILYFFYFATQFLTVCLMHAGLQTALWDFGFNDSIIWNTAHDHFLMISVRGGQNALGEHFTPIFILLAPLYWIADDSRLLFLVQTLCIAGCIPLVYAIARKIKLPHKTALILALGVFFYQPLQNGIRFPFQAQTFADPFLLLGFYLVLLNRPKAALLSFLIAMMSKENIVMEVSGIGLFLIFQRRKAGWAVLGLASFIFLLNTRWIEPLYRFDYHWNKWGYYSHITRPTLEGWTVFLKSFFNLRPGLFLFLVFAPFLFLSFKARGWLWLLGPALAVRLLTSFVGFRIITAHYTAGLNALVFIGSAYGLLQASQGLYGKIGGRPAALFQLSRENFIRAALLVFALLFAGIPQFFRLENNLWEASSGENQRIVKILESIPPDYSAVSTEVFLAHLTHRPFLFGFNSVMPGSPLEKKAADADLLVVDRKRLQINEEESLAGYRARRYRPVFKYESLEILARPGIPDEILRDLISKWKVFSELPEIPYRKLFRRIYKRAWIVLLAACVILYGLDQGRSKKIKRGVQL